MADIFLGRGGGEERGSRWEYVICYARFSWTAIVAARWHHARKLLPTVD